VSHGGTAYFLNVIPALLRAGVDLTVCMLREPHPAAQELERYGAAPIFLSAHRMNPFVAFRVAEIAKRKGCRILHAGGMKATLMARMAARVTPAQVLVHVHDLSYPNAVISTLHRAFARPTDLGICVSRAVEEVTAKGYHIERDRLRVVHNGIRLERFLNVPADSRTRVRESLGIAADSPVLAMIGRFYREKGHLDMVRMMAGITSRCPNAVLLLVGDGPDRAACEGLAEQLGLTARLRFLGQRGDLPELLSASDLVVMPSHTEGLPIAAIEALACGKPVVGFDVGGMSEVIEHGKCGVLVKARDMQAFVSAVVSLLEDPRARGTYASQAVAVANKFGIDSHIAGLLKCYAEAALSLGAKPAQRAPVDA